MQKKKRNHFHTSTKQYIFPTQYLLSPTDRGTVRKSAKMGEAGIKFEYNAVGEITAHPLSNFATKFSLLLM